MNAIVQLKSEHQAIRTALALLGRVAKAIARPNGNHPEPMDDADRLLNFFRIVVDRCHHAKERMLFPVLEEAGIGREKGAFEVMRAEHLKGREAIQGMANALKDAGTGEASARARFAEAARAYALLLGHHIDREDALLFTFAERHLTTLQLNRLDSQFARLESEEVGAGSLSTFHRLLNDLAARYLDGPPAAETEPACPFE